MECFERLMEAKVIKTFRIISAPVLLLSILLIFCLFNFSCSTDDNSSKQEEKATLQLVEDYITNPDGSISTDDGKFVLLDTLTGRPVGGIQLTECKYGETDIFFTYDESGQFPPQFLFFEGQTEETRILGFFETLWCWASSSLKGIKPVDLNNAYWVPKDWVLDLKMFDWKYRGVMKLSTLERGISDSILEIAEINHTGLDSIQIVIHGFRSTLGLISAAASTVADSFVSWTEGQKDAWYQYYKEQGYNDTDEFDIYIKFLPGGSRFDGFFTILAIPRIPPPDTSINDIKVTCSWNFTITDINTNEYLTSNCNISASYPGMDIDSVDVNVVDEVVNLIFNYKEGDSSKNAVIDIFLYGYIPRRFEYTLDQIYQGGLPDEIKLYPIENINIPITPTDLVINSVSEYGITLSWQDNSSNEEGFIIERKENSGMYTELKSVKNNVITFYDSTAIVPSTTYYYRVKAYNSYGSSDWSNEVYALLQSSNNAPQLSNGTVYPSSGDTSTDFTFFITYYDEDGDLPTIKCVNIDGIDYTMSLVSGTYSNGTYSYSTQLSDGEHNYYFKYSDGNIEVRLPETGTYSGPSVNIANRWHIETVDSQGVVGEYTSIALDNSGYPHISYYDKTNGDLKYAWYDGENWHTETVDGDGTVGKYSSICLDDNDYPHISYRDSTNDALKYAWWDGSSWDKQVVDFSGMTGLLTSIVLDGNGYPHLSYNELESRSLKYAWWDGSNWHIRVVDSNVFNGSGHSTSIALDHNDYPHISYYNGTNGDLKYAWWDGTSWHINTIDNQGIVGCPTSIALSDNDYPHICYSDATNGTLKYAYWNGSSWYIQNIDNQSQPGDMIIDEYLSIVLDDNGYPHISYNDTINGDLKYAWWGN